MRDVISSIRIAPAQDDATDQRVNDRLCREYLVTAALVLASHAKGFGGVAFPTFLGRLLYELGVRTQEMDLPLGLETSGWLKLIVPFLSSPNMEWPACLLDDRSMSFGKLTRT